MYITIDSGNTIHKAALFEQGQMIDFFEIVNLGMLRDKVDTRKVLHVIISSVNRSEEALAQELDLEVPILFFNSSTPIPLLNLYQTPATLGADRLAAAVGANYLYPQNAVLVIDAGTCITYDWVESTSYRGGAIAPGIHMRYKALHEFTARLPLETQIHPVDLIGTSTSECIQSGVINGVLAEIEGTISRYRAETKTEFKILLCGGDARFLSTQLHEPLEWIPTLVHIGLNQILTHFIASGKELNIRS